METPWSPHPGAALPYGGIDKERFGVEYNDWSAGWEKSMRRSAGRFKEEPPSWLMAGGDLHSPHSRH
jgi:hypothetical protein